MHARPLLLLMVTTLSATAFAEDDSLELFRTRITPILNSPNASSCSECHLSGVDLKNYIGETQEETYASLVSAGLINTDAPEKSKLLEFISREPEKATPVSKKARKKEYEAFRAWIEAAVEDPTLAAAKTNTNQLGPTLPLEIVRHSRKSRVLRSFRENIWVEMGRCVSCHSPEMNRAKIGRNGYSKEDVDAISWVVPRDPEATLQKLLDTGNIDLENPDDSSVLTKPAGLEDHGGGPKFAVGSRTDRNFRRFLNDYAKITKDGYKTVAELPAEPQESVVATKQFLRIVDLPEGDSGRLLRVDLYRRVGEEWSEDRWATAENPVNGKRHVWQSPMFAVAPRTSKRAGFLRPEYVLPPGRYLARIYIDREARVSGNRDYVLGKTDYVGHVEIEGRWPVGYKAPKVMHLPVADTNADDGSDVVVPEPQASP